MGIFVIVPSGAISMSGPSESRGAVHPGAAAGDGLLHPPALGAIGVGGGDAALADALGAALAAVQRALEAAGAIFVAENGKGPGVRLRKERSSLPGSPPRQPDDR